MSQGFNSMDDAGAYLEHYGAKGMKWGVRRWQNKDGSLTKAGYEHYGYGEGGSKSDKPSDVIGKYIKTQAEDYAMGVIDISVINRNNVDVHSMSDLQITKSNAVGSKVKELANMGYSQSEIATKLGISWGDVSEILA